MNSAVRFAFGRTVSAMDMKSERSPRTGSDKVVTNLGTVKFREKFELTGLYPKTPLVLYFHFIFRT